MRCPYSRNLRLPGKQKRFREDTTWGLRRPPEDVCGSLLTPQHNQSMVTDRWILSRLAHEVGGGTMANNERSRVLHHRHSMAAVRVGRAEAQGPEHRRHHFDRYFRTTRWSGRGRGYNGGAECRRP